MRNTNKERYEVDWCEQLAFDENGDHDMDRERRSVAHFPTFAEAIAAAKDVLRRDVYGAVEVTRQERVHGYPRTTGQEWENIGTLEISDQSDNPTPDDFTPWAY